MKKFIGLAWVFFGVVLHISVVATTPGGEPDFLIIGVEKCGTTSLYEYMVQHPQILGANKKEIHFFDKYFKRGFAWYQQQFPQKSDKKMLIGEASPGYFPKKTCAARVAQSCPNAKLIVILRDPIKRAISQYLMRKRRSAEPFSFDRAIRMKKRSHYIVPGLYMTHLAKWLSLFPKEQIHILFLEDLSIDPKKELNKVFTFLGLKKHKLKSYKIFNKAYNSPGTISPRTLKTLYDFYAPHNKVLAEYLKRKLPWEKA